MHDDIHHLRASTRTLEDAQPNFWISDRELYHRPEFPDRAEDIEERIWISPGQMHRDLDALQAYDYSYAMEDFDAIGIDTTFDEAAETFIDVFDEHDREDESHPMSPVLDSEDESLSMAHLSVSNQRHSVGIHVPFYALF